MRTGRFEKITKGPDADRQRGKEAERQRYVEAEAGAFRMLQRDKDAERQTAKQQRHRNT